MYILYTECLTTIRSKYTLFITSIQKKQRIFALRSVSLGGFLFETKTPPPTHRSLPSGHDGTGQVQRVSPPVAPSYHVLPSQQLSFRQIFVWWDFGKPITGKWMGMVYCLDVPGRNLGSITCKWDILGL